MPKSFAPTDNVFEELSTEKFCKKDLKMFLLLHKEEPIQNSLFCYKMLCFVPVFRLVLRTELFNKCERRLGI